MKLFDMHCDTLYECYETGKHLRKNDLAIDASRIRGFRHYAQFFALFCGARGEDYPPKQANRKCLLDLPAEQRLDAMLQTAHTELGLNADWLTLCTCAEDLQMAQAKNKSAAFLSIEGAELLADADALHRAYAGGVRLITLAWNYDSPYACGANVNNDKGLTEKGLALVQKMMDFHMIIDVSHLSEAGFWELCAHTDAPFAASHSNSRTICPHLRNLTDLQFDEIVRRNGLVGINLFTDFIGGNGTITDVLRHIEHFCARGGESCLALGADFDGCDRLPQDIQTVADLDKIAEEMLQQNYLQSTVDAIFYDNLSAFITRML